MAWVLLVGVTMTTALCVLAARQAQQEQAAELARTAARVVDRVEDRLETTEELLWVLAAAVQQGVSGDTLQQTLEDPHLRTRHPDHVAITFARAVGVVHAGGVTELVVDQVSSLSSRGEAQADLSLLAADPRAFVTARDTGLEAATRPLVHGADERTVIMIVVPVYTDGARLVSPPDRRRSFVGVVTATVDVDLLFADVIDAGDPLTLRIEDVGPVGVTTPDTPTGAEGLVWSSTAAPPEGDGVTRDVVAGDRRWRLTVVDAEGRGPAVLVFAVGIAGLLLTVVVAALMQVLWTGRDRAEALVAARTAELVAANARLSEADALKSNFLTTISHELRTPLTSVLGFAVTLRTMGDRATPAVAQDFVERIERNARSLHRMVEELLDFGRHERGGLQVQRTRVDLGARVRGTLEGLGEVCAGRDVTVTCPAPVWVDGDEHALDRIVSNLVHNACRYSPPGAPVDALVRISGDMAVLEVLDRGPGFGAQARSDELFARFVRGDNAPGGGTGIGLAVVRELARAHGGDAIADDRQDGGGLVRVTLPLTGQPTTRAASATRGHAATD